MDWVLIGFNCDKKASILDPKDVFVKTEDHMIFKKNECDVK